MATNETHIVEIPVHQETQDQDLKTAIIIQQHPISEISKSPGHLLLLKLWQREEHLFARRISGHESALDHLRREIFHLCSAFFFFHALVSTFLFTAATATTTSGRCKKWWFPAVVVGCTSVAIATLVQVKLWRYWKVTKRLKRERSESRTLGRSIQELRMKGVTFDLSKEINVANNNDYSKKIKKSSSVEIKWKPKIWCCNNLVTFCLLIFAGLAFPAPKLFLCII